MNFQVFLNTLLFFFLIFIGFTKSAQFPFRRWLPKAIRAPTPVRALVHRRTLVTAGLILFINFSFFLYSSFNLIILVFIGRLTIFFASLISIIEEDLKKVVALSTLSQIGFSIMILGLGLYYFRLLHLIRHALFKSCLFIQIGVFIYFSFGQQDGRFFNGLRSFYNFIHFQIFLTFFCLCGLFFLSGLISKDIILEFFFFSNYNIFFYLLFFLSIFLTFFYSFRLFKGLLKNNNFIFYFNFQNSLIFISFFLFFFSIFGLIIISNNFFIFPSLIIFIDFFTPLIYLIIFVILKNISIFFKILFLKYSFIVDYFAKTFSFFFFNYKFLDSFFNNFFLKVFSLKLNGLYYNYLNINFFFYFFLCIYLFIFF